MCMALADGLTSMSSCLIYVDIVSISLLFEYLFWFLFFFLFWTELQKKAKLSSDEERIIEGQLRGRIRKYKKENQNEPPDKMWRNGNRFELTCKLVQEKIKKAESGGIQNVAQQNSATSAEEAKMFSDDQIMRLDTLMSSTPKPHKMKNDLNSKLF